MNVIWISSFNELYDSFNFLLMMTAKNGAFFCPLKHDVRLATSHRSQNIFEIAFEFLHSYNFVRSLTIISILDVKMYQETNTLLIGIKFRIWLFQRGFDYILASWSSSLPKTRSSLVSLLVKSMGFDKDFATAVYPSCTVYPWVNFGSPCCVGAYVSQNK